VARPSAAIPACILGTGIPVVENDLGTSPSPRGRDGVGIFATAYGGVPSESGIAILPPPLAGSRQRRG